MGAVAVRWRPVQVGCRHWPLRPAMVNPTTSQLAAEKMRAAEEMRAAAAKMRATVAKMLAAAAKMRAAAAKLRAAAAKTRAAAAKMRVAAAKMRLRSCERRRRRCEWRRRRCKRFPELNNQLYVGWLAHFIPRARSLSQGLAAFFPQGPPIYSRIHSSSEHSTQSTEILDAF